MTTTKRKKKGNRRIALRCPYCGAGTIYRSADGIYKKNPNHTMLYVCSNYPECDSYVRVHEGTDIPVGSLANPELRRLRKEAHDHFDKLYKYGIMSRQGAYQWLADLLDAPLSEAHIGHVGEYYCRLVIEKSEQLLANWCSVRGIKEADVSRAHTILSFDRARKNGIQKSLGRGARETTVVRAHSIIKRSYQEGRGGGENDTGYLTAGKSRKEFTACT